MPTKRSKRRKSRPTTTPTRLQTLRLKRNFSLEDVALETGAFRSAINRWENGLAEPSKKCRAKYAEALGISLAELGAIVYAG